MLLAFGFDSPRDMGVGRRTPRFTRARRAYAVKLAQSGVVNLYKNLAWGVGCKRLLGGPLGGTAPLTNTLTPHQDAVLYLYLNLHGLTCTVSKLLRLSEQLPRDPTSPTFQPHFIIGQSSLRVLRHSLSKI